MKNLLLGAHFIAAFCVTLLFSSCGGEQEDIVVQGNVPASKTLVDYSVTVIDRTHSKSGSAALADAEVTISVGGKTITRNTNSSGVAVFSGLRPGTVNGTVTRQQYAGIAFTADIDPQVQSVNDSNYVVSAATKIYTYSAINEVEGEVVASWDQTLNENTLVATRQTAGDVEAFMESASRAVSVGLYYELDNYPMGSGLGRLTSVDLLRSRFIVETPSNGGPALADGFFSFSGAYATDNSISCTFEMIPVTGFTPIDGSDAIYRYETGKLDVEVPVGDEPHSLGYILAESALQSN